MKMSKTLNLPRSTVESKLKLSLKANMAPCL